MGFFYQQLMAQFTELGDTMEHGAKRSADNRQRLFTTHSSEEEYYGNS